MQVSTGHSFLEAPRWRDGALYASDFFTNTVLRWEADGAPLIVCEVEGQPSGLGWTPDGDLLIVSMQQSKVFRLSGGRLVEHADLRPHGTWYANDMVVMDDGSAYVGHMGWDEANDPVIQPAVIQWVSLDGQARVAADELICPNGMVVTEDRRTLIVAESFAARLTAFDIEADGSLSNRRVWADFADGRGFATTTEACESRVILPDGIALDADGAVWVGDIQGTGAHRIAEGGEVLEHVSTAPHAAFAPGFGGAGRRTLFLCTTFGYGKGDPRTQHKAAMLRMEVATPGAGLP
jgi:sugar lactone lactonase YvrE